MGQRQGRRPRTQAAPSPRTDDPVGGKASTRLVLTNCAVGAHPEYTIQFQYRPNLAGGVQKVLQHLDLLSPTPLINFHQAHIMLLQLFSYS
ncbi:MAG: hypothetical protein MIK27_02770 [Sphingomonas sanguinis]|nr:hypothetical protein [Sphingomonas sanguinis]